MAQLTPEMVRLFLNDSPENNMLLDGVEFSDERIYLAMTLAVSSLNSIQPITTYTVESFPTAYSKAMLYLVAQSLYEGQAAMAARNQMSYSDGGTTIPIEERFEMFTAIARQFGSMGSDLARQIKVQLNIQSGWGDIGSDYRNFPVW